MKKRGNHLYIVCWMSKFDDDKELEIGYLPFNQIPKNSILRDAIFSDNDSNEYVRTTGDGAIGIYDKKKLASEHLKLEQNWRKKDNLWIHKIDNPKLKK